MIIIVHCFPIHFSFRYSDLLALAEDLEDIKTPTRTRTLRNVASRRAVAAAAQAACGHREARAPALGRAAHVHVHRRCRAGWCRVPGPFCL